MFNKKNSVDDKHQKNININHMLCIIIITNKNHLYLSKCSFSFNYNPKVSNRIRYLISEKYINEICQACCMHQHLSTNTLLCCMVLLAPLSSHIRCGPKKFFELYSIVLSVNIYYKILMPS